MKMQFHAWFAPSCRAGQIIPKDNDVFQPPLFRSAQFFQKADDILIIFHA
jgi:hypothetical protein